ncbi:MAG: type II toxin-antitoxin system Phd/YefM family antitoxin [Acidobacteria bacterium]|nr:type II toxin-antitoxin system Phd/YefM family antitoxin [Acidobacteriota bacterium]
MTKVNMHEAKTRLSQLVELAKKGEEVIIAKNGKDEVKIVPIAPVEPDWWGMDEGKGWIADDFDELPEDLMRAFYGEDEKESTS